MVILMNIDTIVQNNIDINSLMLWKFYLDLGYSEEELLKVTDIKR